MPIGQHPGVFYVLIFNIALTLTLYKSVTLYFCFRGEQINIHTLTKHTLGLVSDIWHWALQHLDPLGCTMP